jgi:hypothetical protein
MGCTLNVPRRIPSCDWAIVFVDHNAFEINHVTWRAKFKCRFWCLQATILELTWLMTPIVTGSAKGAHAGALATRMPFIANTKLLETRGF